MGGRGSGNWYRFDAKATVEDCLALDVNKLARDGLLVPSRAGRLDWTRTRTHDGQRVASVGYSTEAVGSDSLKLRLQYRWNDAEDVDLPILVRATRPHFGGRRWWLLCPLAVGGIPCRQWVAKLYLRGRYFGCRNCHDLTYRSCQRAHQTERLMAALTAGTIARRIERLRGRIERLRAVCRL